MSKGLADFDRVLDNPLWDRTEYDPSRRKVMYRFKVGPYRHIDYAVNLGKNIVATSAYPYDLEDFQPEIADCDAAWEKWFRPWMCTGQELELIKLLYSYEVEAVCDLTTRELSWGTYFNDYTFSVFLQLDMQGRLVSARMESFYSNSVPDEFYNPIQTVEGLPEVYRECKELLKAVASKEILQ